MKATAGIAGEEAGTKPLVDASQERPHRGKGSHAVYRHRRPIAQIDEELIRLGALGDWSAEAHAKVFETRGGRGDPTRVDREILLQGIPRVSHSNPNRELFEDHAGEPRRDSPYPGARLEVHEWLQEANAQQKQRG